MQVLVFSYRKRYDFHWVTFRYIRGWGMFTVGTFALLLWVVPPLQLSDDERARVREMAEEYKNTAHCETGVWAQVFLLDNGERKMYMGCKNGVAV